MNGFFTWTTDISNLVITLNKCWNIKKLRVLLFPNNTCDKPVVFNMSQSTWPLLMSF